MKIKDIRFKIKNLETGKDGNSEFISSYEKLLKDGRAVLKKEWNVVKEA